MQWSLKNITTKQSDTLFWLVFALERNEGGVQYCVKGFEKGMNVQAIIERLEALRTEIKENNEVKNYQ